MKKFAFALATLTTTGVAIAQSNVTLWGVMDASVTHGTGSVSSKTQLTNSGLSSSQLGFRGVEDLGGGLKAGFWLESSIVNDDGRGSATNTNNQASGGPLAGINGGQGLTFNRRSTVSVGGDWGEIRLGRDYAPHYWSTALYDPFGNLGVGLSQTLLSMVTLGQGGTGGPSVRGSNSIQYLYNHGFNQMASVGGSGLHASAMYQLGENSSGTATSRDGNGWSVRVGYNFGPASVAAATGKTEYASGDARQSNIGGSYDFGAVKLIAHYTHGALGTIHGKGYLVGGNAPWAAAGFIDTLLRWKMKLEVVHGNEKAIQPGVQA
jgi:predicted porin